MGHFVEPRHLVDSPKLLVYADRLHLPRGDVLAAFGDAGHLVELIDEASMHRSVFISYGGPDKEIAGRISDFLVTRGVKTWFFPKDALPGQKLHRAMSSGIADYDRVLLICSAASLNRSGVLNELERVFEREAREGGSEILIPVAIDRYVFDEWTPARPDIADQVRSRVIASFPTSYDAEEFHAALEKLLHALKR